MTPYEFKYKDQRHPMDGLRDIDDKDREIARLDNECERLSWRLHEAVYALEFVACEVDSNDLAPELEVKASRITARKALERINELKG